MEHSEQKAVSSCYLCRAEAVAYLVDFGRQPICNRYLTSAEVEEYTYPLVLRQCTTCGLVQVSDPVPDDELTPPYDWIVYNEPERHLNQLADVISNLPGLTKDAVICGISFLDEPLLNRLAERGFKCRWRLDVKEDLDIIRPLAGVETIQARLDPESAYHITRKRGRPDVVLAGYILEHAHDLQRFMSGLKELVSPQGYIVVQVPDCKRVMERYDYSALWEEHVLYFTPETLQRCLTWSGLSLVHFSSFSYELEDCLIAIGSFAETIEPSAMTESILQGERQRAQAFSSGLLRTRERLRTYLNEYQKNNGPIALFGAGHRACMFVNLMGIKDYIDFVVDDDPKKQGYLLPGSRLPIRTSSSLREKGVRLCLLSLSPESEEKVVQNNQAFLAAGGIFRSIFPDSKRALEL